MSVSELIDELLLLPIRSVDKHLMPQSYYIDKFTSLPNFHVFTTSCIDQFVSSVIGLNSKLPTHLSLRTNAESFNESNLSASELHALKSYYKNDLSLFQAALGSFSSFA